MSFIRLDYFDHYLTDVYEQMRQSTSLRFG